MTCHIRMSPLTTNSNGHTIDNFELAFLLRDCGYNDLAAADVRTLFAEADADGSGGINFDEFKRMIATLEAREAEHRKSGESSPYLGWMLLGGGGGGPTSTVAASPSPAAADKDKCGCDGGEVDVHKGERGMEGKHGGIGLGDMSLGLEFIGNAGKHGDADAHEASHVDADVSLGGEVDAHGGSPGWYR